MVLQRSLLHRATIDMSLSSDRQDSLLFDLRICSLGVQHQSIVQILVDFRVNLEDGLVKDD
jgi:hypothetical protein